MRASCTTENLVRSPSVAGTNGGHINDDLDEANTDYAESDVMLGGANTSNSNGSNDRTNGNSKLNPTFMNKIPPIFDAAIKLDIAKLYKLKNRNSMIP